MVIVGDKGKNEKKRETKLIELHKKAKNIRKAKKQE